MRRARRSTAWRRSNGNGDFRRTRHRSSRPLSSRRKKPTATNEPGRCAGGNPRSRVRALEIQDTGPMAKAFAKDQLRSLVERIERLEEEKAALTADIREVYSEAKGVGFDTKIMRQVVRLRKLDRADRQEQEAILDLYLGALGMRS